MKLVGAMTVVAVVFGGAWAFIHLWFPDYSHRFRLIVEINTPAGVKSGSSVIQATRVDRSYLPLPGRSYEIKVRGEGVFFDLGGGRNVIAVLGFGPRGDNVDQVGLLAINAWHFGDSIVSWKAIGTQKGQADLAGNLIPAFVTFSDPSDPKSARLVCVPKSRDAADYASGPRCDPAGGIAAADVVFGENITLRAARIEITNDPVTRTIGAKLPWLPHPDYLSGRFVCGPNEPHCLYGGHFTR